MTIRPHYFSWDKETGKVTPFDSSADTFALAQEFDKNRKVDDTYIGPYNISTVFLVIDHNWMTGKPQLFETLVFGPMKGEIMLRYATAEDAQYGHDQVVEEVRELVAGIEKIGDSRRRLKAYLKHVTSKQVEDICQWIIKMRRLNGETVGLLL